jgi:hypothetical protein
MAEELAAAHERLTAFLYLLMRDEVPTGAVAEFVNRAAGVDGPSFDAPELAALAGRYAGTLLAPWGGAERDEEEGEVGRVRIVQPHGDLFVDEEGDEFGPGDPMLAFFDLFDDRIRSLPTFADAVNEAAENDRPVNEDTARIVAARARELAETKGS